jgi:hypothetical protein
VGESHAVKDYEPGLAVPACETGSIGCSASILIQSVFKSRLAVIKAVNDPGAVFKTRRELREWLRSARVIALLIQADWPTPETKAAWLHFVQDAFRVMQQKRRSVIVTRLSSLGRIVALSATWRELGVAASRFQKAGFFGHLPRTLIELNGSMSALP